MLLCFGSAWPASIYTSYTSKTAGGKSIVFLFIVFFGYIACIFHKVFYNLDWVVAPYAINGLMTLLDIILSARNRRLYRLARS